MSLGILDLLELKGFDRRARFKFVRHQEARYDLHDFFRRGWLEAYQAYQSKPVFDRLDYIVAFLGLDNRRARLLGVYAVHGRRPGLEGPPLPPGCPYEDWRTWGLHYDMEKVPGFEELEHRAVIDWGPVARAWHQWPNKDKEVIELLPKGERLRPFGDYLGFTLTHSELAYLHAEPEANREWRARLSAVAGVYLILATTTGAQYVGSVHGIEGFWGRWASYADNGHGGNHLLQELVTNDPAYPEAFSYSILQILPRTATRADVLDWERLYKVKLGSRALGLNAN